ncbi:hypothetical protein [Xylanimonas protaetiae]|uniref:Uncharacterized protein n=1 Tax=Xylanimonas protaetiae TaxID=2509457 RepID=A0A4P6F017_9MICO|nr:hypothetical protein [Xylanimonas protaetiae]QAY68744.1 hypothetical protein ET471_00690 [Xylanimonas protaetiae]
MLDAIMSELICVLIEQINQDGQVDAVEALARGVSSEVAHAIEARLKGENARRPGNHFWCVVMAAICKFYDKTFELVGVTLDSLVDAVMAELGGSDSARERADTSAQDIASRTNARRTAFSLGHFPWLTVVVKAALKSVLEAIKKIGEDAVTRYLRFFGLIMCPDPDRHPAVIRYCLWPLIAAPLKQLLTDETSAQMREWVRANYSTE